MAEAPIRSPNAMMMGTTAAMESTAHYATNLQLPQMPVWKLIIAVALEQDGVIQLVIVLAFMETLVDPQCLRRLHLRLCHQTHRQ